MSARSSAVYGLRVVGTRESERGEPIVDDTFLIVFHAAPEPGRIALPDARWGKVWCRVMDTERGFAIDCALAPDRFEAGRSSTSLRGRCGCCAERRDGGRRTRGVRRAVPPDRRIGNARTSRVWFARGGALAIVVPRLGVRADGWRDTALALGPGTWRDVLTDREIAGGAHPVAGLWRDLPVALYLRIAR